MNFSGISQHSPLGKLLRLPLKALPHDLVVPIIQGELRGYRWVAGSSNHGCWLGSYEFEKQRFISRRVRPGSVVYDIGAHVGFYTLLFSRLVNSNGHVFAFEPLPANLTYLKQHIAINSLKNVSLVDAAVSDRAGHTYFKVGSSTYTGQLSSEASSSTIPVRQVRLDEFVRSNGLPLPDYIKLDIESAEFAALQGATELLQAHRPAIFLATHGATIHSDCCAFLQDLGYQLSPITGSSIEQTDEIYAVHVESRL